MKILKIITLALLTLHISTASAKGLSYIGGMMIHGGYISGGELNIGGTNPHTIGIEGVTTGIGGRLLFSINKHLRLGSEGYVSDLKYGDRRTASIGWGGIAADYGVQCGKFRPTIGLTLGVGGYKNICVTESAQGNDVIQPAVWNDYSLFVAVPYVGVEYSLTQKIRLYSRIDYITAPASSHKDFATGARLHLGFMFSH